MSVPTEPGTRCAVQIYLMADRAPVQPGWHRCELEEWHDAVEDRHHAEPLCGTAVDAASVHVWIRWKSGERGYDLAVHDHCENNRNHPDEVDNDACWLYAGHPGRCAWALADTDG